MKTTRRPWLLAIALLGVLPGCGGGNLGALGDILGGVLSPAGGPAQGQGQQQQGQMRVEIQAVNANQQSIQIRTEQGQNGTVLFDQNTVVVYRQQQYAPASLERGDVVLMQVQQVQQGLYASRIDVEQSVQDRSGATTPTAQLRQMTGRVGQVDRQRGFFDLQTQDRTYTVFVSSGSGSANVQYFDRLRSGDNVRIEGTLTDNNRVELHRFL